MYAQSEGDATVISDNVLGARTDLELRNILNANRDKPVTHCCSMRRPRTIADQVTMPI